jgi:hypothetical protein
VGNNADSVLVHGWELLMYLNALFSLVYFLNLFVTLAYPHRLHKGSTASWRVYPSYIAFALDEDKISLSDWE